MSVARLEIPAESLLSLPSGACYSAHEGQAHVTVASTGGRGSGEGRVTVTASCDSLELACARYERRIRSMSQAYAAELRRLEAALSAQREESNEVRPGKGVGMALKWYFYGLLSGITATILTIILKKRRVWQK